MAQLLALTVCRDPFRSSDRVGGAAGMNQWKHKPEPGAGLWTEEADGSKADGEAGGCSAPPPPPVPILTVEDRVNRLAPLMGSAGLKDTIPVVGQWI